jgi:hypothetical protein
LKYRLFQLKQDKKYIKTTAKLFKHFPKTKENATKGSSVHVQEYKIKIIFPPEHQMLI